MNLDELRSVQSKERRKDSLQHLRDAFYDDVAAYVADLRAARDRRADQVAKPFSDDDVRRMSDELETAEEVAEALYERRVGKVVKLASFAAADMPVETDGMTTQERALFDDLVERIETNKTAVLDVLTGEEPPAEPPSPTRTEPDRRPDPDATATGDRDAMTRGDPDAPVETDPDAPIETDPRSEVGPESTDATSESNVLAGAMGGDPDRRQEAGDGDGPTDVAAGGPTDVAAGGSDEGGDPAAADGSAAGESEGGGSGRTPVDPEPAPPGASRVTESTTESASASDPVADGAGSTAAQQSSVNEEGSTDRTPEPTADSSADRQTVRITRDVGTILGVDEREYDLANEDVIALPAENAEPLVQRDAAERVD